MLLSHKAVENAKPKEKAYKLNDGGGLYLLVKPNGAKYWRYDYRFNNKRKTLAIGVYDRVSLKEARNKHWEAKKLKDTGVDPSTDKRKKKQIQQRETFEAIAREWHKKKKGTWSERHSLKVLESLEREVFPYIGNDPVKALTPPDVLAVIRRVESRGALEIASRVLGRCNNIFKYAVQTGKATFNPASELSGTIETRKVTHMTALKREELPDFLEALDHYEGSIITKLAIQFILLTFVRTNELRYAQWAEFNLERKEWVIPAKRMKMKREHVVPLSDQAIQLLETLHQITGTYTYLFPSEKRTTQPISENTMLYGLYRMGYKGKTTIHGFRALSSTILNESGFSPDAIEAALAHVDGNRVRAAYNRSQYLPQRIEIMAWWADFVDAQRQGGSNIIPLRANL
jgi:integrase